MLGLALCIPATPSAQAAGFDSPSTVMLSPRGGRLTVETTVAVTTAEGRSTLSLTLPQGAEDLALSVPGHTIAQWTTDLTPLEDAPGAVALRRAALLAEKLRIQGETDAAKARLALWSTPPSDALSIEDMARRETQMQSAIPTVAATLAHLGRAMEALNQELAALPETARQAQTVTVVLAKPVAESTPTVPIRYAYTLNRCGWQPLYAFDAQPDQQKVRVRLTADVWQFSGMDWNDAQITLTAQGGSQREPAPLRPWIIRVGDDVLPLAAEPVRGTLLQVRNSSARSAGAPQQNADYAALPLRESTAFASWSLGKRMLREGKVWLPMAEETWKAPLQWLSRPTVNDGRVWLMTRTTLDSMAAWPAGEASYTIEDNAVGTGMFVPKGDKVTLFFGADPRVTVRTAPDARMSGKSGIINKRTTWNWAWNFTIFNGRTKSVEVRLEQPEPQVGDEAITITYDDKPTAKPGPDNTLYWDVNVPAGGKSTVHHGVTISAPQDLQVHPGM